MSKYKIFKNSILLFCVLFTLLTLVSSLLNLILNNPLETHFHILNRAVLTLIGSFIANMMLEVEFKSPILNFIVPYLLFMAIAFLYVYITGFFEELHKDAYRDIFLNDTVIYIVLYIALSGYKKIKLNKK